MNYLKITFKSNYKYFKTILFFLSIGSILGFFLHSKLNNTNLYQELTNISYYLSNHHLNFLILHLFILSFLLMTSLIGIGLLFFFIYLLFESICITYNLLSFLKVFALKGLLYGLIYNLLTKGLYLLLLVILFKKIFTFSKYFFIYLLKKEENSKYNLYSNLKSIGLILIIIILNDILIYFYAHKVLKFFLFIIN